MQLSPPFLIIAPDPTQDATDWPELQRQRRAIVVVDVVESVRLMQANEADVIDRWRRFVNQVRTQVLPANGGRLVKSLGDGLLLEFESVQAAVASSLSIQSLVPAFNIGRDGDSSMAMRIGVHVADVVADELDIYGAGVNLAARLSTLAGPSDIVVSAQVRDELIDGLDAQLDDLGECYLKHLTEPVHAFRLGSAQAPALETLPNPAPQALRPTLAVIPFRAAADAPTARTLGDALADEVIAGLSVVAELNVISRLSTLAFRDRESTLGQISGHLKAGYVVSGSLAVLGKAVRVSVELADAASETVLWADTLHGEVEDAWRSGSEMARHIVLEVGNAVVNHEVRQAATQPLATLRNYSLLLGSITLMHRSSRADFERARSMLEHLIERERHHARPHAWLANWHALRVTQGQTDAAADDTRRALHHARQALERDPQSSLALAIDGVLQLNLVKDFSAAGNRFDAALNANPNEAIAWLFKGLMHAFAGEAAAAEAASERALALSPLDPMRHYYDSLAATAALGAGRYDRAEALARRSLRANRMHPSTYRALAIAQAMQGDIVNASTTIAAMLAIAPRYCLGDFQRVSGFSAGPLKDIFADAMRRAGLPE